MPLITERELLNVYGAILNGPVEDVAPLLSDKIDAITQPLRAKDGEEQCGVIYDPWGEGEQNRCTLRANHWPVDTAIHADYSEGDSCLMWWHRSANEIKG